MEARRGETLIKLKKKSFLKWCSLKGPTLLAVAMDPLNTLERLNIALDEEKQGQT